MCKPLKNNTFEPNIETPLPAADLVGPCGRRCRECRLEALAAGLIAQAGAAAPANNSALSRAGQV